MVLNCNNGQKGIYSLDVIIVYTSITVFISSIYNYSTNHYPWEKDSDFQVSVKEVKFLFVVFEAFLYTKSRTQPRFCNNKFVTRVI